jgi:hypothetical protein
MNTLRTQILALFAVSSLIASVGRADETAYAKILKDRDAVLSQILTEREARAATGIGDEETVVSARLALYSFRRNTALSKVEKIKQQELIVAVWQKKLATLKGLSATGVIGHDAVLLATDSLLEAQQIMEELKRDGNKGYPVARANGDVCHASC